MKTILSLLIGLTILMSVGCDLCKPKCEPKKDSGTDCWRGRNIVAVAHCDPSFKTFIHLLKLTELNRTLRSPGPYTVFMPTDEAFAKLPAGQLDSWMQSENKDQLCKVVMYHIVGGKISACKARDQKSACTLNGNKLTIAGRQGSFTVGNANIIQADIKACNGYIHKIDTVLIPPSSKINTANTANTVKTAK